MLLSVNFGFGQYLYHENFQDISDWTATNTFNNQWVNGESDDTLISYDKKMLYVTCQSCSNEPKYLITSASEYIYITTNSAIPIPSSNYKIKFSYISVIRPALDQLLAQYSYDNATWYDLEDLPMATSWETRSYNVGSLIGFTPGSSIYFRFRLNIGTNVSNIQRVSCAIDNLMIVVNDWDITNLGTTLHIGNNGLFYVKNADYKGNASSTFSNQGTFILDNGSDFFNQGIYSASTADSIIFKGDKPQTFVAPTQPVGTFVVDKMNVNDIVLVDSLLEIQDRLHFMKGTIKTSAHRIPINLGTSNNPIANNDGFVDASVKYYANISDRLFPTGNKGFYRPIVLDNGTLHYTIRYKRENSSATFVPNVLNGISNDGYWIVRMENIGAPGGPGTLKTKIRFASGDGVSAVDETRVAFSPDNIEPYYTSDNFTLTHTGTTFDGTVEINDAIASPIYYIRLGFAKNGKINLKAMLQGPLMNKKKVLWEDINFSNSNWSVSGAGAMTFQLQASFYHVFANKPWKKAFKGLAFINTANQDNRWATTSSGTVTAQMNANVPVSFASTEKYFLEFEYLYDGNASNTFQLQYSIDDGATWSDLSLSATPSTFQRWQTFSLELNSTNFPGFIKGTTPIRFGFKASWGNPYISDNNVPAPLISHLRVVQETTQPEEMTTYLSSSYILDSLVNQNLIPTKFVVPNGVVDTIHVQIRNSNTSTYSIIDQQTVWLMRDGSIKSLSGANHLNFVNTNSGTGYMVVKHRNHLPVMTPNPISYNTTTSSTIIDFSDIANIMDGTAYQYNSGPARYALYLGNATEDIPNGDYYETNSNDFYVVSTKKDQVPDRSYHREDLNLDGFVNAEDFDLVQIGNNHLYFSTVPEP